MHADLIAAIKAGWPRVHFVTVTLPGHTIRWTDAGSVVWESEVYSAFDTTYGALSSISEIVDGIDDDASPVTITIIPPDLTSIEDLAAADAQGGRVSIHLGAVDPVTRILVSEPYRLFVGELDQPKLKRGRNRLLEYDIITGEARGLEPNEEQRQTHAFRQYVWPGEMGDEYATDGTKLTYWREEAPYTALGFIPGRGIGMVQKGSTDKAIQFIYEPNSPLPFPMGRVRVGAAMRYRVGYGPTARYHTAFCTIAASGPIQGLISASFGDIETTFDSYGRSVDGDHAGEMWFSFLPGAQPSLALTSPTGPHSNGSPAPGWGSDHKLSGRACFAWTGLENSKKSEYRGAIPRPGLTIDGLYGWDARLDSTMTEVGGSGASRLNLPATWTGIKEGGHAALNWVIGRWEGSNGATPTPTYGLPYESKLVGGIGVPLDMIDVPAFVTVSEVADGYGWTMACVPFSDEDKIDVLEDMLAASGARRARRGGLISAISLAHAKASVVTVTRDDAVGAVDVSLGASRLGRINTGIPSNLSEEHRWEITAGDAVSNPSWVAEDGGRRSEGFTYKYVDNADQAAALCYLEVATDREKIAAETTFKPYMLQVEAGECFDWDEPEYLLAGVKVMVLRRSYDPESGLVKLRYRQQTDAKIAEALALSGVLPPPTTPDAPPDGIIDPPTDFDSSVSGNNVTLTWKNGSEYYFQTVIFQSPTSDFDDAVQIASSEGEPLADRSFTFAPGAGNWWFWIASQSIDFDLSVLVGAEAVSVVGVISPGQLDDADVVRTPVGYGGLVVDADTADRFTDGLKLLSVRDTADTPEIALNAVTDPTISAPSGAVSILSTTKVLIDSITVTVDSDERVKIDQQFDLDMISTAGTRGDTVAIAIVRIQRGLDSDPGVVYLTPNRRIHHVHADSAQYATVSVSANDFPPAGTHTYYVYGACVYAVLPPSTVVFVRERSAEITRFKR